MWAALACGPTHMKILPPELIFRGWGLIHKAGFSTDGRLSSYLLSKFNCFIDMVLPKARLNLPRLLVSSPNHQMKKRGERSLRAIIYRRAGQMTKVRLKSPWLLLCLSVPVGLAANLQNAARLASPCNPGSCGLSQCSSASPFPGLPFQRPNGQSSLSVAGRQPSQGLRQYIPARVPTSPALLPRFNFIFIRSIKKDIFSRSKGHGEHERNTVTGQEQVMWYPHRKTSCFQGRSRGWETVAWRHLWEASRNWQTQGSLQLGATLPRLRLFFRKEPILGALSSSAPSPCCVSDPPCPYLCAACSPELREV